MQNITKRQVIWIFISTLILMMLTAMQFTDEVQWNEAAAYSILLLAVGGSYELWQWLKTRSKTYRLAFGVGLAAIFLLGMVSGAVGIIGSENNPANLMYWAVFAAAFIGSLVSRFKSRGMSYALFTAAIIQLLIPVIALNIWPAQASWGDAGVIGVFILNSIFAAIFAASGFLFRRESATN